MNLKRTLSKWWFKYHSTTLKKKDLTFIGIDRNGKRYFTFKDLEQVPKSRVGQLQNFAIFDELKLTPGNLQVIVQKIQELNEKSLVETKIATRLRSQISALCEELIWRQQNDTPIDILMNMAAALSVREDEAPEVFDQSIHAEKVDQFKIEEQHGNFFFIQHHCMNQLKPSLVMSSEEFQKHWKQLTLQGLRDDQRLATISPEKSSDKSKKATTN